MLDITNDSWARLWRYPEINRLQAHRKGEVFCFQVAHDLSKCDILSIHWMMVLRCSVSRWRKTWHCLHGTKNSTVVEYHTKFNCGKKTDSMEGIKNKWTEYLILLFIHLVEEQTHSGKYKNITQKYIKFISAWCFYIFLNRFILWDERRKKWGISLYVHFVLVLFNRQTKCHTGTLARHLETERLFCMYIHVHPSTVST